MKCELYRNITSVDSSIMLDMQNNPYMYMLEFFNSGSSKKINSSHYGCKVPSNARFKFTAFRNNTN